jgi:hypothetical protein
MIIMFIPKKKPMLPAKRNLKGRLPESEENVWRQFESERPPPGMIAPPEDTEPGDPMPKPCP